ncbi:putative glutamine rich protein [Aspergillus melleus]|uniref:putative glutamine rich protein n=1 Tax=Aspergillus melleus TaxID=138277 RepID=UPI001E8EA999|nr:SERTA domain-containing protein 3 [Aspergillus melleus]KAH8424204.1 SERTA domain-containing protein 3 [Aspergillus melleus]
MSEFSATTKPDGSQDLMDDDYSKTVGDLTRQQEQEIFDKIIALPPDSTSDFATSMGADIVPDGFGLSISDLLALTPEERWKDYDLAVRTKAKGVAEKLHRVVHFMEEEAAGGTPPKDIVWTHEATDCRNQLSDEQKSEIIEKINNLPSDGVADFVKALETSIIPEGFGLSLMDIQAVAHPDKWLKASPETREKAQTAFTRIDRVISQAETGAGGGVKKRNWVYYRSEADDVPDLSDEPSATGGLRAFHFAEHAKATEHLATLCNGLLDQSAETQEALQTALSALSAINQNIERFNVQNGYPAEIAQINVTAFQGHWRSLFAQFQGNLRSKEAKVAMTKFCRASYYPVGWIYMPPADGRRYFTSENWWLALTSTFAKDLQEWYANSLEGKSADYDAVLKKKLESFNAELSQLSDAYGGNPTNKQATLADSIRLIEELKNLAKNKDRSGYDLKMNEIKQAQENGIYPIEWMPPAIQDSYWASPPPNKVPSTTSHPAANPPISSQPQPPSSTQMNGHSGANSGATSAPAASGGQLKVISVRPRVVKRRIEPGLTATGEPIRYIQKLGEKRANFVVEGADGSYRLVSSATAGGVPALEGAVTKGVPFTVQREAEIQRYKERVRNGGEYGCFFVAIGELDLTKERLPFIVVGFHHSDGVNEINEAISRSNLGKILSPKAADRMIVEGIVGHPNMTLREVLMYQISLAAPLTNYHMEPPTAQRAPQQSGYAHLGGFEQRQSLPWGEPEPLWFQKARPKPKRAPVQSFMNQPESFEPAMSQAQYQRPASMPQQTMGFMPQQQFSGFLGQQPNGQFPYMGGPYGFMQPQPIIQKPILNQFSGPSIPTMMHQNSDV